MITTRIVVPCYNEAERLKGEEFKDYAGRNPNVGFVFVDDGSSDDTGNVLAALCASLPEQFEMVALAQNCGKAEAVRAGLVKALERKPQFVGYWDADLATPLCEIERFQACFKDNASLLLVTGARIRTLGKQIERSVFRHYVGRGIASLISIILNEAVYDTQCGAKLFRVEDQTHTLFNDPFTSRWLFDVEILMRLQRRARLAETVYELSLEKWIDVADSKIKLTHAPGIFLDLFRLWLKRNK